jgi:type I restriction enzyme, S subunit
VINSYKGHLNNLSYGAAIQNINTEIIRRLTLPIPPEEVLTGFYSVIEPIHEQIDVLSQANSKLSKTRDRLLPRLISGKLVVEDLDIQFPPSMT